MDSTLVRAIVFVVLATITLILAYLYQRNQRVQRVHSIWIWPVIFAVLAAQAVVRELPKDPQLLPWLIAAFFVGLPIGILRGVVFGVRAGERPGEILLRPTIASGAIYLLVFYYNEFVHVFEWGDPNLGRFSCAFLVMTAGNSIAVNVTRLFRYRAMLARGEK